MLFLFSFLHIGKSHFANTTFNELLIGLFIFMLHLWAKKKEKRNTVQSTALWLINYVEWVLSICQIDCVYGIIFHFHHYGAPDCNYITYESLRVTQNLCCNLLPNGKASSKENIAWIVSSRSSNWLMNSRWEETRIIKLTGALVAIVVEVVVVFGIINLLLYNVDETLKC